MSSGRLFIASAGMVLFACGSASQSPEAPMLSIMIGGQSNAVGHGPYSGAWASDARVFYMVDSTPTFFGPNPADLAIGGTNTNGSELGMGPAVADAHPGQTICICKSATDSSTIAQLTTGAPWARTQKGIDQIRQLSTQHHYVWIQGEADCAAPSGYLSKLQSMAAALRVEFAAIADANVRFYIVRLNVDSPGLDPTGLTSIRADQASFVAADPNAVLISVDDMGPPNLGFHYDSLQEIEIGRRIAVQIP